MTEMIRILLAILMLSLAGVIRAEETSSTLRIVTCAPNLAEFVHHLGMFDHVVGVSRFTEFPAQAAELPAVTDFANPGLEAITAIRPNVIVTLESNRAVTEYFAKQPGVRVVQIGKCETFADAENAITTIADALGIPEIGRQVCEDLRRHRHELRVKAELDLRKRGAQRTKVLMVLGGTELRPGGITAIGHGTHITELLEMAGGENVVAEDLGAYPMLNKEALLRFDPDVILFFSEPPSDATSAATARATWSVLPTLRAVKREDGFRYVNDPRLMVPGPRALEGLAAMYDALH